MADEVLYLNAEVELVCTTLLPEVDKLHVSPKTYAELEQATFVDINVNHVGKTRTALAIVIDGMTWFPLDDDPSTLARTEYLLFDGRTEVWNFYERIEIKTSSGFSQRQVNGALWHLGKNAYTSMVSDTITVLTERGWKPWSLEEPQVRRMIRVAIALQWLMQHDRVTVAKLADINDQTHHYFVNVPDDLSADVALRELLNGKHIRREPTRLERLNRKMYDWLKKRLGK